MGHYLSDRRRVELILPSQALHRIVHALAQDEANAEQLRPLLEGFAETAREPVADLDDRAGQRLLDRARRVVGDVYREMEDRPIASSLRATIHWLQVLIEGGQLVLVNGSTFARTYEALIDAVAEGEGNLDLLDDVARSACKAGDRMLGRLRMLGYYA
jgi:hypothetical protein